VGRFGVVPVLLYPLLALVLSTQVLAHDRASESYREPPPLTRQLPWRSAYTLREVSGAGWVDALGYPGGGIDPLPDPHHTRGMSRAHPAYVAGTAWGPLQPLLAQSGDMPPALWQQIKPVSGEFRFTPVTSRVDGAGSEKELAAVPGWVPWVWRNLPVLLAVAVISGGVVFLLTLLLVRRIIRRSLNDLAGRESIYRTIYDAAPDGIWLIDKERQPLAGKNRLSRLPGVSQARRRSPMAFVGDIIRHKTMVNRLRDSERRLCTLIDADPACVKILDSEGRLLSMNAAGLAMIQADSYDQIHHVRLLDLVDEPYRAAFADLERRVFQGESGTLVFKARGLRGASFWLETHAVPLRDDDGVVMRLLAVTHDVTQRVLMEQEVKNEAAFLQSVIDGIGDSIMVIDTDYTVRLMNAEARASFDPRVAADPEHPRCYEVAYRATAPCAGDDRRCPMLEAVQSGKCASAIHSLESEDGAPRRLELVASTLRNPDGSLRGVIEISRDITEHQKLLEEVRLQKDYLNHLAYHDILTNLPNRILFLERLEQAIRKSRQAHEQVALFFIDLDQFKQINDSLGHATGDLVLREVATRFSQCVRGDDMFARFGGDEFTIIMDSLQDTQQATLMAQKLIKSLERPIVIETHQFYLTASIGISLFPQDGESAETLMRNADAAMYQAKDEGRNTFQYYTEHMTAQAFERIQMIAELRKAIKNNELIVYYQPQMDVRSDTVVGLEALVRWRHPELGMVSPARFVPLAEDTGLILPIGEWVLESACRQVVQWHSEGLGPVKVAVNISAKQLGYEDLLKSIQRVLQDTGCRPQWLELEVTEGFIMKNPEQSIRLMEQIRALGVDLAIDDFGTGYLSLAYLKRFPITQLKIDASFIRDIPDDPEDIAIIRTIIGLGKSLGLNVIAEGVETEQQQHFLSAEGCHLVQGYIYSRPLPADEAAVFLRRFSKPRLPDAGDGLRPQHRRQEPAREL